MFNVTRINKTEVQLINNDLNIIVNISILNLSNDQIKLIDFYSSFGMDLYIDKKELF